MDVIAVLVLIAIVGLVAALACGRSTFTPRQVDYVRVFLGMCLIAGLLVLLAMGRPAEVAARSSASLWWRKPQS
jgi:predicted transporter